MNPELDFSLSKIDMKPMPRYNPHPQRPKKRYWLVGTITILLIGIVWWGNTYEQSVKKAPILHMEGTIIKFTPLSSACQLSPDLPENDIYMVIQDSRGNQQLFPCPYSLSQTMLDLRVGDFVSIDYNSYSHDLNVLKKKTNNHWKTLYTKPSPSSFDIGSLILIILFVLVLISMCLLIRANYLRKHYQNRAKSHTLALPSPKSRNHPYKER
jgi:hypothetical protein